MHKKKSPGPGIDRILIVIAVIIILAGIATVKNPTITGRAVESTETVFKENLNLELNESGTYEWEVKNPGSIKSLKVTGSASPNGTARVYIEKNGTRGLLFDSTRQLFDVDVNVLPEYKGISRGGKIIIENSLFNLRGFGSGDVLVVYSVKDSKGNRVAVQEETMYVETRAKFLRELVMPSEIRPGIYTASVEASFNGSSLGSSSDTFEVKAETEAPYYMQLRFYVIFAVMAAVFTAVIILAIREYDALKKKKEIAELKENAPAEKISKLENELKALEGARKAKLISAGAFENEKLRINAELSRLKK